MRYKIRSVQTWDIDEILEMYPCLKDFGMEIISNDDEEDIYIVLNSIEELMELVKSVNQSVIIDNYADDEGEDDIFVIEIYDDWLE